MKKKAVLTLKELNQGDITNYTNLVRLLTDSKFVILQVINKSNKTKKMHTGENF